MFQYAKCIWIKGKSTEKNVFAAFRLSVPALFDAGKNGESGAVPELHITGATFYRVYINGKFAGFGPARTALGYAREDIIPLTEYDSGEGEIVIEAAGYYCRSISTVFQPSYVMAEVQYRGKALVWTSEETEAFLPPCKLQVTERYSEQRHFTEVWDYRGFAGVTDAEYREPVEAVPVSVQVIPRVAPYPMYEDVEVTQASTMGKIIHNPELPFKKERYSDGDLPDNWNAFAYDEIPYHPYAWIQQQEQKATAKEVPLPLTLNAGEYMILDFRRIEAGFFRMSVESLEECDVVISFSEYYEGEDFELQKMNAHNVLEYFFSKADEREVLSFEPYTCRFAILAVKSGKLCVKSFGMKTYMFDIRGVDYPDLGDETLNAIYRAGVRTFAHNAVDLYTDCPSRERAGWLCDSYFTAKTEYALTGKSAVEEAFLENYRLYKNQGEYLPGVIPMCYPSDALPYEGGGKFIPQWTMWYIIEAHEYILKRGHEESSELFRDSIYQLLDFYRKYENAEGLLERLPSWNFVEWSKANSWTKDVNYPTNFLYAQVLECIADLYGDEECRQRSAEVRRLAAEQSFNGVYFRDHAVRDEAGELCVLEDSSEACQYYAILFGGVDLDKDKYASLKDMVLHVFSPDRTEEMPEIMVVNAFIGAYLRIEVLLKMKEYELLLRDISRFFGSMEERTGTLWEYRQLVGSFDHGFASYALVAMKEAVEYLQKK